MRRATRLTFTFLVRDYGWAEIRFGPASAAVHVVASYVSDALSGLVTAVAQVCTGATSADEVTIYAEPGEVRVIFDARQDDVVVSWVAQADAAASVTDEGSFTASKTELARAIVDGCTDLDREAYRREWPGFEVPEAALGLLRTVL